ncbi:MAG TPA: XdhC family protein [Sumerlaeia bacterium]|nr:XdhC family protein [Sumerlaeia bacterium]
MSRPSTTSATPEQPGVSECRRIVDFADSGRPFAAALVLRADGSTPQKAGARAIIDASGDIWGTLGGGGVEAEAQRRALEACRSGRPSVFDFAMDNESAGDAGAICGGTMRILIDPTAADDRGAYEAAAGALERRERGVLLTRLNATPHTEVSVEWLAEDGAPGNLDLPTLNAIRSCLEREAPRLCLTESDQSKASTEVFVEPVIPKPLLLVVGGGHIGQALAHQAAPIGFEVVIIDDRREFTEPALFPPGVATRCGNIASEVARFSITRDCYVVLVTRGHHFDAAALEACIHAPAAYIGMIGSKRKVALVRRRFIESGLATAEEFDRIFAPIGLDIGAVTVPEIATSIAAELIAVRRKGRACVSPGRRESA